MSSACRDPFVRFWGYGERGHRAFGQAAAVADLPFVVGFDQNDAGQEEQGGWVGEHTPTTPRPPYPVSTR